jgi:DNA polymerase III alpha subunit
LDIEGYLVHICPKEHYQRLIEELQEYRARNMIDLLRWLKYFVDTCRKNNIVWGVGRGSSVASYVLFLLDVHKIDSIKYKLNWQEFLR